MNIVAISGSLRKGSYNTALLRAAQKHAPSNVDISIFDISTLPPYNQDDEVKFPAPAQALKNAIESSDGVIIATPEFNRSISGVLKNAIDWASRPWGKNSFAGKNVLVLGASSGQIGTAVAQQHLKTILLFLDAYVIGQPEFYLSNASQKFDENGELIDTETVKFLTQALETLLKRIQHL